MLDIGAEHFVIDFYVLPLDGYDVVLGVQWLRELRSIVWDFDLLSMAFWRDSHAV
uniref:Uncharacterized protein n=1 Tax=Arundo donax TaxID=35708 RepID=A0A0A8Z649_ARUDO